MSIRGIIFDFDGTLFDSMRIWETAGTDYLASLGLTAEEGLNKKLETMSLMQSAKYLKEHYSLTMSEKEIMEGVSRTVEDFYFFQAAPKDNVIPVLSAMREKGIKMCIATATERYQAEAALKRWDMLKYFDGVIACSEVGCGKDKPDIFEYACRYLKTDKRETAVFEDACHAAKTAKKAGFFVIGIYDRYEKQTEELKNLADIYVTSFYETDKLLNI